MSKAGNDDSLEIFLPLNEALSMSSINAKSAKTESRCSVLVELSLVEFGCICYVGN